MERPRITHMTLSFLLLLMILVKPAAGKIALNICEISAPFRSGLIGPNVTNRPTGNYCRMDSVSRLK